MIAALRPTPPIPPTPSLKALAAVDTPPSTPGDSLDFSVIDSPKKAAQLPALNGLIVSLLYGSLTGSPPASAAFTMLLGQTTPANVSYTANPEPGVMMRGSGKIGQAQIDETWRQQPDGSVHIDGTVGNSQTALVVSTDNRYWHVDGRVGDVEVHQKGFVVLNSTQTAGSYVLDGTLNDLPYHTEIRRGPTPCFTDDLRAHGYLENDETLLGVQETPYTDGSTAVECHGYQAGVAVTIDGILR